MPLYPSAAIVPLGFLFLFLVFLRDFVIDFIHGIKLHMGAVRWILALVFPIVFLAVMWVFTVPLIPGLNILLLGFVSILFVILFSFLGMPLAFTLIIMGIVLMGYTSGLAGAWMVASTFVYQNASNYNFIIIPLYVIMSVFITVTGIGTDSYKAAYRWVGHWRGGLAHASVIACAALGAVQGSPTTAIVTLGPVAIPEMRKHEV